MRVNAQNIKDWADQKKRENEHAAAMQRQEEMDYAQQQEAILRMRGMLEDENNERKAQHFRMIQAENRRLAQEKRDREDAWRRDQESQNQAEVTLTNHHEVLGQDGKITKPDFKYNY